MNHTWNLWTYSKTGCRWKEHHSKEADGVKCILGIQKGIACSPIWARTIFDPDDPDLLSPWDTWALHCLTSTSHWTRNCGALAIMQVILQGPSCQAQRLCFECGKNWYFIKDCPQWGAKPASKTCGCKGHYKNSQSHPRQGSYNRHQLETSIGAWDNSMWCYKLSSCWCLPWLKGKWPRASVHHFKTPSNHAPSCQTECGKYQANNVNRCYDPN